MESDFILKRKAEKKAARDYQKVRHADWNDNYELNRNKVKTNRLTQRQAVNMPLMKETIKTILSKIDDLPEAEIKDIDGDEMKEILVHEMWEDDADRLNFEGIDLQDKKTVLLYGRGFKKLNWDEDGFQLTTPDIFDIVIDPLTDPLNIETARFIIHQNIFRSLKEVLANPDYESKAKRELQQYTETEVGMVQTGKNREEMSKKNERMKSMGITDDKFDEFAGGDVIINLTEHIYLKWTGKEFERYICIYADDEVKLYDESLMDCLGVDFLPYVTWSDDVETNDFWSDGVADIVRTPNKVVNVWYSQMIENRTLSNFGMHWYDATNKSYEPSVYEPGQGVMMPAPGDPNKTIMPVQVSPMDDNMNAINFVVNLIERATAATAIDKGVQEGPQTTLGEVQILVGKAMERTQSMAKFYRRSWKELAMKWYKLTEANQTGKRTLYKKSSSGHIWPKTVYQKDWKFEHGARIEIHSSSEQEQEVTKGIQRLMFLKQMFPNNQTLARITQKRALGLVDFTPAELREVEDEEKKNQQQPMQQPGQPPVQQGAQPGQQPDMVQIQNKMNQLNQLQGA